MIALPVQRFHFCSIHMNKPYAMPQCASMIPSYASSLADALTRPRSNAVLDPLILTGTL